MFCDASGNPQYPGKMVKELVFSPLIDNALPSWLAAVGSNSILTFGTADSSQGYVRSQTQSATPAIGDQAGFKTSFNIATAQFDEISFIAYGVLTDTTANAHELSLSFNDGSHGCYWKNTVDLVASPNTNKNYTRVYPASEVESQWKLLGSEGTKRKDLGITYRRKTQEVFFTAGDPYEGAGMIAYNRGNFVDFTGQPMQLVLTTVTAAQRWVQVQKIKARFVTF